ncbi:MAG: MG2 domain-containing protein [Abditibacteriales bacterium]|nr:MG2 domain-containing protein [Abditibacteriales bacterium]
MFCFLLAQEEATGRLRVRVVAKEDGRPLKGARVRWTRQYDESQSNWRIALPTVAEPWMAMESERKTYRSFTVTRDDGWTVIPRVPAGKYTITHAETDTHASSGARQDWKWFSIEDGKETVLVLRLPMRAPYVWLALPQRTFRPQEKVEIRCETLTRAREVKFRAYAVDARRWLTGGNLVKDGETTRAIHIESFQFYYDDSNVADARRVKQMDAALQRCGRVVQEWTKPLSSLRSLFTVTPRFGRPGLYVVRAEVGAKVAYQYALVTDLGIIVKHAPRALMVYAMSLTNSRPLQGVKVDVIERNMPKSTGTTDATGIAHIVGKFDGSCLVLAQHNDSLAWLTSYTYARDWEEGYTAYLYTDRPIYRPNQTVYFKGIVRHYNTPGSALTYNVPAGKRVRVVVRDVNGDVVHKDALTLNAFGSFYGSFRLPDTAPLGNYDLVARVDNEEIGFASFAVAEYRKPEFTVTVKTDRKRYVLGDTVRVSGNARYYFGSPVAKAKVRYTVMRSHYWRYYDEEESEYADYYDDLNEEESYYYGEEVGSGETQTDERGEFSFSVATKREEEREEEGYEYEGEYDEGGNYQYHIQVEVTDSAERSVNGSASVLVTRGDFDLWASPDFYVYQPKDTVTVTFGAEDFDGKPQKNVEVTIEVFEPGAKKWPKITGRKIRDAPRIVKPPAVHRLRTDEQGRARLSFVVLRRGPWEVVATAYDRQRNKITAKQYLWVASESFRDPAYQYPDLALIADKKIYSEDDTARILVNTSAKNVTAIVSLEGARVYRYWLIPLKGGSQVITVPLKRAYVPNVYLSVCFANGKRFVSQHELIKVSPRRRTLSIDIQPDRKRYAPRDTATYTVAVRDSAGKPVQAEISLGLVDEAIYGLKEDKKTDIVKAFYRPRYNAVTTRFSFPEIYLGGGKEDGIDVEKAARRDFRDTWHFAPAVVTDANGVARLTLKVPDNLTTWRATVKAHTLDTSVGSAMHKVQVKKDLMVRLIAPRFFTQKDESAVSAVVHNETEQPLTVRVHLNAQGVVVMGDQRQTVAVGAGKDEKVNFRIAAPKAGEAKLLVSAIAINKAPTLSDAMELTLPVQPHGIEQVLAQAGMSETTVDGAFTVPPNAIPEATRLQVRLSPSVAGQMFGALEYLTTYPYGCVEQMTSRFVPNVLVKHVLDQLGGQLPVEKPRDPKKQPFRDLPKNVRDGLQRLYQFQRPDGGWGWWAGDETDDPYVTAYVMYALALTQQAGYSVAPDVATRGMGALRQQFGKVRIWNDAPLAKEVKRDRVREAESKSFVLFAYAEALKSFNQNVVGQESATRDIAVRWFSELHPLRQKVGAYALALLTLSAHSLGLNEQATTLAELLERKAIWDGDMCHWSSTAPRYTWMDNDIEATAYALKALLTVKPESRAIVPAVLWLAKSRRDHYWYSTKTTAVVLFALADYIAKSRELSPDATIVVYVNGKREKTLRFTAKDVMKPEVVLTFPRVGGRCTVRLEKTGSGRMYYGLTLRTYVEEDPIAPQQHGFRVERIYSIKDGKRWIPYNGQALNVNDDVRVELKISGPPRCDYVMIEDMLPSGCEVKGDGRESDDGYDDGSYLRREVRDNRVVFFLTHFEGYDAKYPLRLTYIFRPELSGTHIALPTTAMLMYQPEVRGHTREARLEVR